MEAYKGMLFELQAQEVRGHGFTAEAVILEACGDSLVIRQVIGSPHAALRTRDQAEELAARLAREWIEEHGDAQSRSR